MNTAPLDTARRDLLMAQRIARVCRRDPSPPSDEDRRGLLMEGLRRTYNVTDLVLGPPTSEREEWLRLCDEADRVRADLISMMPRRDLFTVQYERSLAS